MRFGPGPERTGCGAPSPPASRFQAVAGTLGWTAREVYPVSKRPLGSNGRPFGNDPLQPPRSFAA